MTTVFFPVPGFYVFLAQIAKKQIVNRPVDQHPVRNLLADKEFVEIEFPEIISRGQQVEGVFLGGQCALVGRFLVLPDVNFDPGRSIGAELILVNRVRLGVVEHPARINRPQRVEIAVGFKRVAHRIKQIVGFVGFAHRLEVPGFLLPVVQGIGPEFDFAAVHPDEIPVVIGAVTGILAAFKRVLAALS